MSKKVRKSRSSSLVALFLTLILSLSLTGCVRATPVEGKVEVPPFTILIDGKQYTEANFAELPVYECTASSTNNYGTEETYVYTGYQLEDVLNTVGAPVTNGLTAVGSDGYEHCLLSGGTENRLPKKVQFLLLHAKATSRRTM